MQHLSANRRVDRNGAPPVIRNGVQDALAAAVDGEVSWDAGARGLYAADASNYRQVPIAVVVPRSIDAVAAALEVCRRYGVPVLPRGCGTSLSGETCNEAVVIDFSRYLDRILEIDPERRIARVEPGCILDNLRDAAEEHGLTFGPDPATHNHCTLGGMIGNNSGGVHALMAGLTVFNVRALEVLTYDGQRLSLGPTPPDALAALQGEPGRRGEIYRALDDLRRRYGDEIRRRYPRIPRRVSGYENLDQLFDENGFNVAKALVGTEGTCVTVLEVTLDLVPSPPHRVIAILGFPDVFAAADAVPAVLEHGPIGLEGMDDLLAGFVRKTPEYAEGLEVLPEGKGWLIAQFGGATEEEARGKAEALAGAMGGGDVAARVLTAAEQRARIWEVRDAALAATAWVPDFPDTWPGWEDSAVPRERFGDYLRALKALFHEFGYEASVYGHFGDGLVHCRIDFDLRDARGVEHWRRFLDRAADLVVSYGGSLSGEHGDGQARAALLEKMYGPELIRCFREFKAIWDPDGMMNPGKVVNPNPITADLRVGPDYRPPELETTFAFREDDGSFARAAMRCVGVGKCRRLGSDGGVMCPSFMVTRDEKHTTRGRAHLLFEMTHGGVINDGWRSDEVEDALKLCLACKGCKSDCPVNVDMATYKAEFRSHYYKGRLRPRAAYSMGLIYWWARAASKVPRLANFAAAAPGLGPLVRSVAGIDRRRRVPEFPRQTFREWFVHRAAPAGTGPRVLLWTDTFSNYLRPATAIAATQVLEAAGFNVTIPPRPLCCGRPLYDQGMLATAKRLWSQTFETLRGEIDAGTPVVGLEPACTAAFKDELVNLYPDDERARRLSKQTAYFADFAAEHLERLHLEPTKRKALMQIHCNHHAVIGAEGERRLLEGLGLDFEIAPAGCCGMAGAFGFDAETCDVSIAAGERVLLPMVRAADADTVILADGFSCREQIEQGTGRPTLHVAELIAAALPTNDGDGR